MSKDKIKDFKNNFIDFSQPWIMEEKALRELLIKDRTKDIKALHLITQDDKERAKDLRVENGVAVIGIKGPIFKRENLWTFFGFGTSLEALDIALELAIESLQVTKILLDIDSPGGEMNGTSDMAAKIKRLGAIKPIEAFIGGTGASGAFWLASAASKITISNTALVGSIGTVLSILDLSKFDEKMGIKQIDFVSSQSPKKKLDINSKEGQSDIQIMLDKLAQIFIDAVATNRGVSAKTVIEDFGQGFIKIGIDALKVGMIDNVGSFTKTLQELIMGVKVQDEEEEEEDQEDEEEEEDLEEDEEEEDLEEDEDEEDLEEDEEDEEEDEEEEDSTDNKNKEVKNMSGKPINVKQISTEYISKNFPKIAKALKSIGADAERKRIENIEALCFNGNRELVNKLKFDGKTTAGEAAQQILKAEKAKLSSIAKNIETDAKDLNKIESTHANDVSQNDIEQAEYVKSMQESAKVAMKKNNMGMVK